MKTAILLTVILFVGGSALISDQTDLFAGPAIQISHSGGTDKCGCHRNSKTGDYHCHTRKKRGGDCPPKNVEADAARKDGVEVA